MVVPNCEGNRVVTTRRPFGCGVCPRRGEADSGADYSSGRRGVPEAQDDEDGTDGPGASARVVMGAGAAGLGAGLLRAAFPVPGGGALAGLVRRLARAPGVPGAGLAGLRSEERRVGKECRSRWGPSQ